jgi:hypothetical protein
MSKKWSKARRLAASAVWTEEKREAMREAAKARWAARRGEVGAKANEEEVEEGASVAGAPNEEESVGQPVGGMRRLLVTKVCVNPRLVEGIFSGEEKGEGIETVDVGRNANFAIGDEVWVRRHGEALDLWEFAGLVDLGIATDMVGLPRDRRRVR